MRLRIAVLAAGLLAAANLRAETLRQILQQNGVPISGFNRTELDAGVSSGAADSNADRVLLAYPTDGGDGTIGPPLHVVVYLRGTQKSIHHAVVASETSDACFGSAWGITEHAGFILVKTHLNPSALCTLVLDSELRVRHTLFAWSLGQLGPHSILLEEDQIHFANVHPLRLEVFDLATGRMEEIYPPDGDPLRAQFSLELKKHLPSEVWCREHDHPCDASSFDEDLGEVGVADAAGSKVG